MNLEATSIFVAQGVRRERYYSSRRSINVEIHSDDLLMMPLWRSLGMSYSGDGFTPVSPYVSTPRPSTGSTTSPSTGSTPNPPPSPPTSTPNPPSSPPTSKSSIAIITTMAAVGVVMLIVITIMTYKYRQNKRQKNQETSSGVGKKLLMSSTTSGGDSKIELASTERFIEEFSKDKPMRFSPDDLIAFTRNYSRQLGSGGFGVVYKGEMYNGVLVAVKVLKKISDTIISEQFAAELFSIGRTYHINLVKLYGFCFDNEMKALVYEYMENGSLESCLADKGKLDWEKLYQIAIGTARGIRYLHEECHKMIIHYDIKPGNVLLSQNFSPKVADFGMAELWDRESTLQMVTQGRGTPGFIAPELSQPLSATHKCDVYSYGMLLFQIVGSRKIMEGKQADSLQTSAYWVREKAAEGEFVSIMSSCGIEEKDRLKAKRICEVALTCVQLQPEKRPSMSTILMMLEGEKDICVEVSLHSNADSGESAGSKPELYSKVASDNLGGSKPEASGESGGSKSEQYNNVTFDELGGSNAEAFGELGDSKSEASGGSGGSKSEQYNNVTFDKLGGSKSEASVELGGSKSEQDSKELGGSKTEASSELGGSKSEPDSEELGGSKTEASGELGGSKSEPASNELDGLKPEIFDEFGGSKSESGGSKPEIFDEFGGSKSESGGGSKSESGGSKPEIFDEFGGSKSESGGSKPEIFDEFGGSKPELGGSKPKASDELVSNDLGGSKPKAFDELPFGDLGGSKSEPCEPNSDSQADVDIGSSPAKQVTSN